MLKTKLMRPTHHYSAILQSPEAVIEKFRSTLNSIEPHPEIQISFDHKIQRHNLISLLKDANRRINQYEQIYPYIKEICSDQIIDPTIYDEIKAVQKWALKLGRGERSRLSDDIKDAWLTYIILLSCSMIDRTEDSSDRTLYRLTRSRKNKILRGNN